MFETLGQDPRSYLNLQEVCEAAQCRCTRLGRLNCTPEVPTAREQIQFNRAMTLYCAVCICLARYQPPDQVVPLPRAENAIDDQAAENLVWMVANEIYEGAQGRGGNNQGRDLGLNARSAVQERECERDPSKRIATVRLSMRRLSWLSRWLRAPGGYRLISSSGHLPSTASFGVSAWQQNAAAVLAPSPVLEYWMTQQSPALGPTSAAVNASRAATYNRLQSSSRNSGPSSRFTINLTQSTTGSMTLETARTTPCKVTSPLPHRAEPWHGKESGNNGKAPSDPSLMSSFSRAPRRKSAESSKTIYSSRNRRRPYLNHAL